MLERSADAAALRMRVYQPGRRATVISLSPPDELATGSRCNCEK